MYWVGHVSGLYTTHPLNMDKSIPSYTNRTSGNIGEPAGRRRASGALSSTEQHLLSAFTDDSHGLFISN